MIGGDCENAIFPAMRAAQDFHETSQLRIHPTNPRVIHGNHFFIVPMEAMASPIRAIPESIEVTGARSGLVLPKKFESVFRGVVRGVRIHEVQPKKKGTVADRRQPCVRLVNDDIGCWKAAE